MRPLKIKTKLAQGEITQDTLELSGWLDGKRTYLWIGEANGPCRGILSDHKLYRLAKAIVKQFERKEKEK